MKKITILFTIFMILAAALAFAAYTVNWTINTNAPFYARAYFCPGNVCSNTTATLYQTSFGNTSAKLNFTGTGSPDRYAIFIYPEDACKVPTSLHVDFVGSGNPVSSYTFFKQESSFCGSNVNHTSVSANNISLGSTVTITSDLQSAWGFADPAVTFTPADLAVYYDSIVDVTFTVNGLAHTAKQIKISPGSIIQWKAVSYNFTPNATGNYTLRIATKMDNDCKCNGSNYKYEEVIVKVTALPCVDECSLGEYCTNNTAYECGNFDADSCLELKKIETCGNSTSDLSCVGGDITETFTNSTCVVSAGNAYCEADTNATVIESCGLDFCTEYTVRDPEILEYVRDENTCSNTGIPYCVYDPGKVYDFCLSSDILLQAVCVGDDQEFQSYDCNTKDGCYPFDVPGGSSESSCGYGCSLGTCEQTCPKTGMLYRNYSCGTGACSYVNLTLEDADSDFVDDRCDSCIDKDHDSICDSVDNCPFVNNPTQVDTDDDGLGNACDEDKDSDGYPAGLDCNDWNKEVYPGAPEIPNNGRDDDCNPFTTDKGVAEPRQIIYIDTLYNEEMIQPGGDFVVIVSVTNTGKTKLDDLKIEISFPGFQERQSQLLGDLRSAGKGTRQFILHMPAKFDAEYEYLRITVSNDEYSRKIYRELKLPIK